MKRKVGNVFYHVFIITFALLMLYPLLWMISASFKDTLEIFQGIPGSEKSRSGGSGQKKK